MSEPKGAKESGQKPRPALRVHLEGELAAFGRVPAADVADLLRSVERVVARAASVAVARPSRRPGRREQVVSEAAHMVLKGIEEGSLVPVLELPQVTSPASDKQAALNIPVAHLGEIAVAQVFDIITGKLDGHPYVVEALATMARELKIGDEYDAIRLDMRDSQVASGTVTIDLPVRKRLTERVRLDRAAAREGMLVGTLVEADFESYKARLRSPDGQAVEVSFDPSLADQIHEGLREPATVEGWVTYDPTTQRARSILPRTVRRGDQLVLGIDAGAFRRRRSFAQLQREQGVTGIFDITALHDTESSEEELDAYEAVLQQLREA